MTRLARRSPIALAIVALALFASPARAQTPPPRIGPFAIDLHGTIPLFPNDSLQLAESRGLTIAELPGHGFGGQIGAHVYVFRWRAVTVGIGGEITVGRAHESPPDNAPEPVPRPVTERFFSASPQLSLNFGTGRGWSYLSAGIGRSTWSLVPDGQPESPADSERLKTVNYGGGARWFAKKHLAFSFDVRFYGIDPGTPVPPNPGSPRTTLVVIGAGISVR